MFRLLKRKRTLRTFVVLGCPRGGTSLLAGALKVAGVHMGEFRTNQYEDPDFNIPLHEADRALERLEPVIVRRNRDHLYWGWKLPNNIYYIDSVRHLLVEPCYLFVYRDLFAIARSSARHDKRDWEVEGERLLRAAVNHTRRVRAFQSTLRADHHVFQLEAIHADPSAFVDRLKEIVFPLEAQRDRLLEFVDPRGGYHALD